ncbi:hypothetical protein RUM43_012609 [Polyplax serrata]|uniref:ABC-2 type transporter transmembrane domain-containing protein n=1 Tax=Polyplax serrata TaxID=468196 RepID=A0AAN8PHW4_POLSC
MRNGKLLDEGPPSLLLTRYKCSTIEQVFLLLSSKQDRKLQDVPTDGNLNVDVRCDVIRSEESESHPKPEKQLSFRKGYAYQSKSTRFTRMKSLLVKNILRVVRHPGGLGFTFILPVLEIITFFMTIGGNPQNLRFGIVNEDMGNFSNCNDYASHMPTGVVYTDNDCIFRGLSCHFLTDFYNSLDVKYNYVYYNDLDSAMKSVKEGNLIGVLYFAENFTESFTARLELGQDADEYVLDSHEIKIWLDMTNGQTAYLIQQQMYDSYFNFSQKILKDCGLNPKVATIPVAFHTPVYGSLSSNYGTFIAPGVIVTLIFFLAVTVTSIVIITERDEGVWDRTLVSGVTTTEILLSHLLTQGLVMILQTLEVMVTSFGLFGLKCHGSFFTVLLLLLVQGLCGMCTGMVAHTGFQFPFTATLSCPPTMFQWEVSCPSSF